MIVAATGHRPNKLGGYGEETKAKLYQLASNWFAAHPDIDSVISGMELGWDTAWADAAHSRGIPYVAAVPFKGQESFWPDATRARYSYLLERAERVEIVSSGGYSPRAMLVRNAWMVDHSTLLVALWNGTPGGTANTIRYAKLRSRTIENLWSKWELS